VAWVIIIMILIFFRRLLTSSDFGLEQVVAVDRAMPPSSDNPSRQGWGFSPSAQLTRHAQEVKTASRHPSVLRVLRGAKDYRVLAATSHEKVGLWQIRWLPML
jgi:hypothetical protein